MKGGNKEIKHLGEAEGLGTLDLPSIHQANHPSIYHLSTKIRGPLAEIDGRLSKIFHGKLMLL